MSGFQEQLDRELGKRGLAPVTAPSKPSLFSGESFLRGLALCSVLLLGLVGWAWFNADATKQENQKKLASKTAIIQNDANEVYRIGEESGQPVLTMPQVDLTQSTPASSEGVPTPPPPVETAQNAAPTQTPIKPVTKNENSLIEAPVAGLYESTSVGLLPARREEDNLTPFEAYKRPFQRQSDKPVLSFVIFDAGLSRAQTEKIINDFPPEVTLAFSPYSRDLKLLTDVARQDGHEVWLTLPLETKNYPLDDPGPSSLLVNASAEQNKSRLMTLLASTQGYAGFFSQKDHVFRREDAVVNPALQEIFERGLAIIDTNTSLYSFVGELASRRDYPNAKINFWLDDNLTAVALNQKTRQMIEFANANGKALVMLRPNPASLNALDKFLKSAAAKDYQIAPASAQIKYGE